MENARLVLTENAIKRHSKRLQQFLQTLDIDYSLTQSQNAFAKILGMADYHELHQILQSYNTSSVVEKETITPSAKYIIDNFAQHIWHGAKTVDIFLDFLTTVPGNTWFHIQSNEKVHFSLDETKKYFVEKSKITNEAIEVLLNKLNPQSVSQLQEIGDISFAFKYKQSKLVINATRILVEGDTGISLSIKKCLDNLSDISQMVNRNLLSERNILQPKQGLVIISGKTGSGKSTLLQSIIQKSIYENKEKIITYENPVEYVYDTIGSESTVSQNQLSQENFTQVLRSALRRKPSIISIGEVRDAQTMREVLHCSMTGHAVYTSIHAANAIETIKRLINIMPQSEQYLHAIDTISSLSTVVCNMRVTGINGKAVLLQEYLHLTDDMKERLIEKLQSDGNIDPLLQLVKQYLNTHGCSFSKAAIEAYDAGLISAETLASIIKFN